MHHNYRTWIEISRSALHNNINNIYHLIAPSQLAVVIKANGYGHGLRQVAQIVADNHKVSWFCTASIEEALELRALGITKPLLVLAYKHHDYREALTNTIDIAVYDYKTVEEINNVGAQFNKKGQVHIKVDTGMARLGLQPQEAVGFIKKIKKNYPFVTIAGILTHVADKDNLDQTFTYEQLNKFDTILEELKKENINIPVTHALSSGVLELPSAKNYYMARAGTNIYGFWSSDISKIRTKKVRTDFALAPILTWKTRIIQCKKIPAGSYVGYACTFKAQRDSTIAVLPVGYVDGYPRSLANKSYTLVNNCYAPVIGLISMNLMMIDVTDVPQVTTGTEVTLLGPQEKVHASFFAELLNTINIELTTRLNPHIPRIITE